MKQVGFVQKYNYDFSKGSKFGCGWCSGCFSKTWMKNKMINYLITSINDPTLDLNMALKTMGE